jgi:hypothetical protein
VTCCYTRIVLVASGNTLPRARRALGVSLGGAVALLLAACGGDAGSVSEAAADEPGPEVTVQSAQPSAPADAQPGSTVAADADTVVTQTPSVPVSIPVPITPEQPPQEPAPLPTAEIEATRPLLPPAPAEVIVPPGDCRFEFLGEWVYCENEGWPNAVETDATDLLSCMQQCLEREDCTAVTDYLWLGQHDQDHRLGCYLHLSTCETPAFDQVLGEEDLGRSFRRGCATPAER